jgi:hypothetical protein
MVVLAEIYALSRPFSQATGSMKHRLWFALKFITGTCKYKVCKQPSPAICYCQCCGSRVTACLVLPLALDQINSPGLLKFAKLGRFIFESFVLCEVTRLRINRFTSLLLLDQVEDALLACFAAGVCSNTFVLSTG